jgi:hypothetical protein
VKPHSHASTQTHALTYARARTHEILIAFLRQQWFRERYSMSCYMYIACILRTWKRSARRTATEPNNNGRLVHVPDGIRSRADVATITTVLNKNITWTYWKRFTLFKRNLVLFSLSWQRPVLPSYVGQAASTRRTVLVRTSSYRCGPLLSFLCH